MQALAPASEYADDHAVWAAESQARARRWLAAERIVSALIHAAHSLPPSQRLPTRDSHAAHLGSVAHFVEVVRDSRLNASRFGAAQPRISPALARAMSARGVLVTEVEAAV